MGRDPAFLFYSKDWLEGTADLMPDEKGVYIDLLCHQHQRGFLPKETVRLARLVGLSHEEFLNIWAEIKGKFIEADDGMINKKLSNEMHIRKEKSEMNTITGTFASLLKRGNFSKKEYTHIRKEFNPTDFKGVGKELLTERLTEWLYKCLKSIGSGNGSKDIKEYPLEEKQQEFKIEVESFSDKYPIDMLTTFYAYWSEPTKDKKEMKKDKEETWDTSRRLVTWNNNQKQWSRK